MVHTQGMLTGSRLVLQAVRGCCFLPHETRSGRWLPARPSAEELVLAASGEGEHASRKEDVVEAKAALEEVADFM